MQGEVADFVNESQFEGGETAYACVAFSAALIQYAGEPGKGPTNTGEAVDQLADYWYGKEEGSFAASNTNGMSTDAEYMMLRGMGLKFHVLPISDTSTNADDITYIKAWLALGYPVMICGAEANFFDLDLGDIVPYGWTPSGNHCIVASGIASDGNLLVRDTASIGPSGVRPGPRRYDAGKMQLVSGTAVEISWLPSLPANFDPTKGGGTVIPQGWTDDGTTLRAPNGVPIVLGFRIFVLANNWHPDNWPIGPERGVALLEASNPSLGGGTQQLFRWVMLAYASGHVFMEWVGVELAYVRDQLNTYYPMVKPLQDQVAALQAQIAQIAGLNPGKVKDLLSGVGLLSDKFNAELHKLITQPL